MKKQKIMEQNKKDFYLNTKLYSKKGHRIACFGQEKKGKLEIFELWTSPKDSFRKWLAYQGFHAYNRGELNKIKNPILHPKIYTIDIKEGNSPKFTFKKHCMESYYHKSEQIIDYRVEIL